MTFLYPRSISISRENVLPGVGDQGYSGITQKNRTQIVQGIPAHIQAERLGTSPTAKLPADAAGESVWRILMKVRKGLVQDRDFISDEMGHTYQVISAYWNPMVTQCICQIMET